MKTKYFILAAIAAVGLASCADDVFVGDNSPNVVEETTVDEGSIRFSGGFKAITRADHVGADAASMLNNKFVVGGFKGSTTAATGLVFDNYVVKWTENTAGTTESNTSDWEYVGITGSSNLSPVTSVTTQTIKYWDYSQVLYDFVAYSTGTATAVSTTPSNGEIKVTAFNTTNHSFTLTGSEEDLTKCYIADRVTVEKADFGKEVTLSFRNMAAKVRVALYETIPGYSVKKVEFYQDDATTAINANISSYTDATLIGNFYRGGLYTITYPGTTSGQPDFNKAHVAITPDETTYPSVAFRNFGALDLTTGEGTKTTTSVFLKRTSTAPSFAGTDPYYQTVLPNEDGGGMELRINYTLEANDGQGEEITVHGAKAYVPVGFTQWLPNYAYTYIFKISDNSNGWTSTSESDPAGLYPITFDAVVVDSEEKTQTTITTVATPSITTYQKGHVYTDGPEYNASTTDPIYVQVMVDGALKGDLASKGKLYTLSADETEAEVMNALSIQEYTSVANTIAGRNKLTLTEATSAADFNTIPREDGNTISITAGQAASFAATAGIYAYVYDTNTYHDGVGVSFATEPADWADNYYTTSECTTAATTFTANQTYYQKKTIRSYVVTASSQPDDWAHADYYTDEACTTKATTWAANTNYYKKFIVDNKIYGVKVIKVV